MAIYHCNVKMISRGTGRSCVAAAAYRAGVKLKNGRDGQIHDYTKKKVAYSEIIAPVNAPEWAYDRSLLWNMVEVAEKRKDAQTAREAEFALPNELTLEENIKICQSYAAFFVSHGMIVDFAIHANKGNMHAHFLMTTRDVCEDGFRKKNREWNTREFLGQLRSNLAGVINSAMKKAGIKQSVSEKSFIALGKELLPTIHEGYAARQIEKRGGVSELCEINRQIKAANEEIERAEKDKAVCEEQLQLLSAQKKAIKEKLPAYPWCRMISEKDVFELVPQVSSKLADKGLAYIEQEIKNLEALKSKLYDRPMLDRYVHETFFTDVDERIKQLDEQEMAENKQYNPNRSALAEQVNKAKAILMREEEYLKKVNEAEQQRQKSFIKRIFFSTEEQRKKANAYVRRAKEALEPLEQALAELDSQHKLKLEGIECQRNKINRSILQEQRSKAEQLALKTVPNLARMLSCIDTAMEKLHQLKPAAQRHDLEEFLRKTPRPTEHGYSR